MRCCPIQARQWPSRPFVELAEPAPLPLLGSPSIRDTCRFGLLHLVNHFGRWSCAIPAKGINAGHLEKHDRNCQSGQRG